MTENQLNPRSIREQLEMTQEALAEELGISQSRISRLEQNPELLRPWQVREYSRLAERAARMAKKAGASQ